MAFTILKPEQISGPVRGVLFDMDGLVLDSEKLYTRFWIEAAAHYGFSMVWEQALQLRAANRTLSETILHRLCGPDADWNSIRLKRNELLNAHIDANGIEIKPGIRELLDCLKEKGIPAAITSSSPPERIRDHLSSIGLHHRFTAICSGYTVPNGKPAPDIYLHGAAALGQKPEDCLALEDAPTGIESAWRAGCLAVIVPDLDQPQQETLDRCFAKADSLLDVAAFLRQTQP